jgi:hypothetical protein
MIITYLQYITMSGVNNMFSIKKFCEEKITCQNVGYSNFVTASNDPSISNKMRYSQFLRSRRFKTVKQNGTPVPPINNERPLYLLPVGQILAHPRI